MRNEDAVLTSVIVVIELGLAKLENGKFLCTIKLKNFLDKRETIYGDMLTNAENIDL